MHENNASKVAQVTAIFWLMKICATTLGETAGDLISMTLGVGYQWSSIILLGVFLVALTGQLAASKFHPALYWMVILATSTAGTTLSDYMDRTLGLGYAEGALILVGCLLAVLAAWYATEGTVSVENITTRRAESFYWVAILFSNTLGTAFGDYLADDSGLGFLGGAGLIAGVLVMVLLASYFTRINRIGLFWTAFVLTRPFGATLGDLLTKPVERGGLDLGTSCASLVLGAVLAGLIVYTTLKPAPGPAVVAD